MDFVGLTQNHEKLYGAPKQKFPKKSMFSTLKTEKKMYSGNPMELANLTLKS
jgi:hypothetical protein